MSQIEVDKVIPQSGTNFQIGEAGDTINLTTATVNLPTWCWLNLGGKPTFKQ